MTARDLLPAPSATPADPVFQEIAELAAQLCGAAYAAITLHEADGHRTLATAGGLDVGLMPRDTRFCCAVLHSGAPLEVSDASFDLRFHDDPFVSGGPRIRFYSGVPLVTPHGRVIGTVSVLDPQPNVLTARRRESLWSRGCWPTAPRARPPKPTSRGRRRTIPSPTSPPAASSRRWRRAISPPHAPKEGATRCSSSTSTSSRW